MVGVEVRQEHVGQVRQADHGAHQLALRPFGAVDQQPVAAATEQQRGRSAARGRRRPGGAKEDDVEVHGK